MKTFIILLLILALSLVSFFLIKTGRFTTYDGQLKKLSTDLGVSLRDNHFKTVAVGSFTDLDGNVTNLGALITGDIAANLISQNNGVSVIDLTHLSKTGETYASYGIDALVTGKIIPFDDEYRIEVTIMAPDN